MSARTGDFFDLSLFELPQPFVEPALRALRLVNTTIDAIFYDTGVLANELLWRGEFITTDADTAPRSNIFGLTPIDLSALSNPEGCILVVDATGFPAIRRFDLVQPFIDWCKGEGRDVSTVTISGVGSSALGSAALAWNTSAAIGHRVAAIVPGYGLADVVAQSLSGWFGFGLHDALAKMAQSTLAFTYPNAARPGRRLLASAPGHDALKEGGPPVFRTGSGGSDVLHILLQQIPGLSLLLGHSKGALAIGNAIRSLDPQITGRLNVFTFGCPISEDVPVARYVQRLGVFDSVGQLNAWGNWPESWIPSHHSTNSIIPLSMPIEILTRLSEGQGSALDPPGTESLDPFT